MSVSVGYSPTEGVSFGFTSDQSRNDVRKNLNTQYRKALQFQPGINRANAHSQFMGTVEGAREAGLHPLFALGGGPAGGGAPVFAGATEGSSVGGSYSSKFIRPEEAAMIRESNARRKLLDAQAKQVEAETLAIQRAANVRTFPLEDGPAPQAEGKYQVMGGAIHDTAQSQSAQGAEDRYHELGGFFQGLVNLGGDAVYNFLRGSEDSIIDLQNAFKRWAREKGLNFESIYKEPEPWQWWKKGTKGEYKGRGYTR